MRVVTTCCSNTEIVCALGCADMLVGVDDHSDWPADAVARAARVGPDLGVDPARVAALKPDLVLASLTVPGHEAVVDALGAAGLPLHVTRPFGLEDVARTIEDIARLLGVAGRGAALAAEFRAAMTPAPGVPAVGPRPRVLIEWWPKPVIAPGGRSWASEMIALAGGVNPLAGEAVESRPLDDDDARRLDPDAVVIAWCGVPLRNYRPRIVLDRPGWREVSAVRAGRVFPISEAYLGRPGPRLVDGLAALGRVVAACGDAAPPTETIHG